MPVELWVIPVTEHRGKTRSAVEQSNSNSLHIINTSISQSPGPSEAPTFTFWFRSSAGAEEGVISKKRLTLWPLALLPLLCCHLVLLAQSYPGDEGRFDPPGSLVEAAGSVSRCHRASETVCCRRLQQVRSTCPDLRPVDGLSIYGSPLLTLIQWKNLVFH